MQSGARGQDTAKLRLASARRRVHAFLGEIRTLEGSEFPHADARDALREIKKRFLELLERTRLPPSALLRTVDGVCLEISRDIEEYTAILGFLLRSTNVRNAFELHSPLKAMICRIVGDDKKLVISSEWDFVPFTYPMSLALLPDFVLVGGPATESANAFLTPLAGHEIGHSAWRFHSVGSRLRKHLASELTKALRASPSTRGRLRRTLGPGYDSALMELALPQLEEVFCDAFGLFIFADSYAHAFEYVMMPGGLERSLTYPADEDRIRYIREAASWFDLPLAAEFFANWRPSKPLGGLEQDMLAIVDTVVGSMAQQAFEEASTILTDANIRLPEAASIKRIYGSFQRDIPDALGGSLPEIVSAGWRRLGELGGLSTRQELARLATLNEVMLKSVEVSEFLARRDNA